jgi:pimeloyl-ACP methyl ester carboxylesterase
VESLRGERWGAAGDLVVLVHGSMAWGAQAWAKQERLADAFRLFAVDRRGFGATPAAGRVDFEQDARDLASILDGGAHLVGHSYGAVGCLLAAAARPDDVLSLTLVEPASLGVARGNEAVERFVAGLQRAYALGTEVSPEVFMRTFYAAAGGDEVDVPRLGRAARAAVRASMTERPPWEAELPLADLAAADVPVLVVRGSWERLPVGARRVGGAAIRAVSDVLARSLHGESVEIPAAGHAPQYVGEPFNAVLRAFLTAHAPAATSEPAA